MRLSGREKLAVATGSVLVACLLFWMLVWEPVQGHLELLDRRIQTKQTELREIRELAERYQRLKTTSEQLEGHLKVGREFSALSYLEKLAVEQNIRSKVTQMRARGTESTRFFLENPIEIKMEKVSLPELVSFLYGLDNPKQGEDLPGVLRVKQLRVHQRFENKSLLDVTLQVSTYQSLEKS